MEVSQSTPAGAGKQCQTSLERWSGSDFFALLARPHLRRDHHRRCDHPALAEGGVDHHRGRPLGPWVAAVAWTGTTTRVGTQAPTIEPRTSPSPARRSFNSGAPDAAPTRANRISVQYREEQARLRLREEQLNRREEALRQRELGELGVLPNQVVDTTGGWSSDGRVVPMMVVHVEPGVQSPGPGGL